MSNSGLVDFTRISPNKTVMTDKVVKKLTPHHVAGVASVETLGEIFAPTSRQASCQYGIGSDGRVGLYVYEKDRAWTSSNSANDSQAVTFELSNISVGGEWPISDKVLEKFCQLAVDICLRNGIPELIYTGDETGNLTLHQMFAATSCPGPYFLRKLPEILSKINYDLKMATVGGLIVTGPNVFFRVRKAWEDSKSQVGAFASLEAAIAEANLWKSTGYKVFDSDGRMVYDPNAQPIVATPSDWAKDAWDWVKDTGLMDGTNPQGPVTREMMATLFYRWALLDGTGVR